MTLSRDDQARFDAIERSFLDEDPAFAKRISIDRLRRRRVHVPVAYCCIGVVLLLVGVIVTQLSVAVGVLMSVAGFCVLVAGVALFADRGRSPAHVSGAR